MVAQSSTRIERFVLDAQSLVDIDTTGEGALNKVLVLMEENNIAFALSRFSSSVHLVLGRYWFFERLTESRMHATNW